MGLLGYGFRSFTRNRGRTVGIVLGVAIAVTLVAGTTIATEKYGYFKILQRLDGTAVDLKVWTDTAIQSELPALLSDFKTANPLISDIYPVIDAECHSQAKLNGSDFIPQCFFGGTDATTWANPRFLNVIDLIAGEYPQNATSILVDVHAASMYNISLGANVSLEFRWGEYAQPEQINLTISGIFSVQDYQKLSAIFHDVVASHVCILSNFAAMEGILDHFNSGYSSSIYQMPRTSYDLLLNYNYLNLLDPQGTNSQLQGLTGRIMDLSSNPFDIQVFDAILTDLSAIATPIQNVNIAMQLAAIPAYILGLYLTIVLTNQAIERRLPELGQLRSRGGSKKQITRWLAIEATVVGIVGGALGYLGGQGASYLVLSIITGPEFPALLGLVPIMGSLPSILTTLFTTIALGVGTCLLGLFGPLRRVSKIGIVDATKAYLYENTTRPWRSRLDLPILLFGIVPIAFSFFLTPEVLLSLPYAIRYQLSSMADFIANLALIAPFFLAFGITKFVAGHSPRLLTSVATKFARIFGQDAAIMIGRNIGRRPMQSGGILFLISLSLCFGIATPIAQASGEAYASDLSYAMIGADILIKRRVDSVSTPFDFTFRDAVRASSPDILSVTIVTSSLGYAKGIPSGGSGYGSGYSVYFYAVGVNASEYASSAYFLPSFSATDTPTTDLAKLAETPNGTIVYRKWAEVNGFKVGDSIEVRIENYSGLVYNDYIFLSAEIVGFLDVFPGAYHSGLISTDKALFNQEYLNETIFGSTYRDENYLIRLKPDAGQTANDLAPQLESAFAPYFFNIYTSETAQTQLGADQILTILEIMDVEYLLISIIATMGLVIIITRSFSDRRREVATLRARGMSRGQLLRLEVGEGFTLIIFGILLSLIGILVGYSLALQFPQFLIYLPIAIHQPLLVPAQVFWYLGGTVTLLIVVTWIISTHEVNKTNTSALSGILRVY